MKLKNSSGATSTILLVLAVVLIVLIIIVFVVLRINATKTTSTPKTTTTTSGAQPPAPAPVYDTTVNQVRFVVQSAQDMGSVLQSHSSFQQNLTTTEKFIEVTIGAQNKSKTDTVQGQWNVGNITDSDGNQFISIDNQAYSFLPNPNLCGSILKPEFDPVPCVNIYEVAKSSTGLKVEVDATSQTSSKKQTSYLDLNISN